MISGTTADFQWISLADPGTSSFREKIEDKILKRKEFSPPKCAGSVASLNDNAEKREDRKEDAEEERGIEESEKDDSHIVTKPGQLSASPTDSRKRKRMTAIEKVSFWSTVIYVLVSSCISVSILDGFLYQDSYHVTYYFLIYSPNHYVWLVLF